MSNNRYNIGHENADKIDSHLLYVTSAKYDGDWHSTPHSHDFVEFFYVLGGKGRFLVENEIFDVNQDDCIVVNPHIDHTEKSLDSSPLEYIVLGASGLSFSFTNNSDYETHSIHNYKDSHHDMLFFLKALLKEVEPVDSYSDSVCQNLFEVLIINMMRHTNLTFSTTANQRFGHENSIAKRYIDKNFKDNVSLDDLARVTHLNKFYLSHSFSEHFGISPINYLLSRRLKESKYLLLTTNYSMAQIAQIVGFSSPSYFSQYFLKAVGQTPRQFRKEKPGV